MSSKRKVPAGIKAISEFFSPVPPKVNRRGQQSLQEENASTSEKSATSVPENTSSLEGINNAAPTSLENVTAVSEERATTDFSIGLEENAIDSQDTAAIAETSSTDRRENTSCGGNSEATEWYKSMKLTQQWLQSRHECLRFYNDAQGERKRLFVKCLIGEEFEFEAKKYSRNGVVPLGRGCRADSKKKLMDVVDHLLSQPHKKSSDYKQLNRQWKSQSNSHPWIHYLTKQREETVKMLIRLSIDVYNDCLLLTPTAFSGPGRSLASLHSDQVISSFRENGF